MAESIVIRAGRFAQQQTSQLGYLWRYWQRRARQPIRVGASTAALVLAAAGSAMAHGYSAAPSSARLWRHFAPVQAWTRPTHRRAAPAAAPVHALHQIDGRPVLQVLHVIATAYGPTYAANYPYGPVDAYGKPLTPGMVAVDPHLIPMRSTLYVTGYHDRVLPHGGFLGRAMDTGGAIQGHRIDIFMNQGRAAVSHFGIEPVTVYVLGTPQVKPAPSKSHAVHSAVPVASLASRIP